MDTHAYATVSARPVLYQNTTSGTSQVIACRHYARPVPNDELLLDEIEEIFCKRLREAAQSGIDNNALQRLASKYNQMYDLVDAGFTREAVSGVSDAFKDETYDFVVEGFFERIEKAYDPSPQTDQQQADRVILQTRNKLQRIQMALFSA